MNNGTDTAAAAPAAETEVAEPAETQAEAKPTTPKVKKAKTKAKRAPKIGDEEFAKQLIDLLYQLRKNNATKWVDLRNSTKEGEQLHKMLISRPTYTWRKVGSSYYLESKHDGNDTCVAYVLPHDPMAEYRRELREYQAAIARRRSKNLKEPKKPASAKKSWRWVITNKRGSEEHDGTEFNLPAVQEAVMKRQHLFAV